MIQDDVLQARIPRLGTVTTGRGTEAESQSGRTYSMPTRSDTLVWHTNDQEVADAVQVILGGTVLQDSPTWGYDVVTDAREARVLALPAGFRQALESWRAAECVRRCDGVTTSMVSGRPAAQPCLCQPEIDRGQDRTCTPHTILPVFLDLQVERFGVWEVRSNSWGTAASLKGTMRALAMVGADQGSIPAILTMVDRKVRDTKGKVQEVTELHLGIATSHAGLQALAGRAAALDAPPPVALPEGDDRRRMDLMASWVGLQTQALGLGLRAHLAAKWVELYNGRDFESLSVDDLLDWVTFVREAVEQADRAQAAEDA